MTTPCGGVYNYTYQLQRSAHGAGSYSNVGTALTAQYGSASLTDSSASSGTSYDYRVLVTDSTGTPLTANTNVVNITTSGGAATSYTFMAPSPNMGPHGTASGNFTVTPVGGTYSGTITITPSGGGLSSPVTLTFSSSSAAQTFTITPTARGAVTLTPAASPALGTDPLPLSYVSLPTVNIVPTGDSLTYGQNASSGQGTCTGTVYPGVLMTQLQGTNSFYACTNTGVAGQTMATMLANASSVMLPAYDGTKDLNIAIVQGCTNDIGAGTSAATCWANTSSYITTLKGYGYKVVLQTITPSSYSGYISNFNTVRDQYTYLERSNWKGLADAFSDTAADSRIGWDGNENNTTYYNGTDKTHLTDVGYAIDAAYPTQAVQSIIDGQTSGGGAPAGVIVGMLMSPF
jgi:lysophospholipase L1-like esterase